ncbi:HTH araC/xylS-type domain-containing protein [Bordetella sputigena]
MLSSTEPRPGPPQAGAPGVPAPLPPSSGVTANPAVANIRPITLRQLLNEVARRGRDPRPLCDGLGFSPDDLNQDGFFVSGRQATQLIRRALPVLGDPVLGLEMGAGVNIVSWGLIALGLMACASSRQLLDFIIEHQHHAGCLPSLHGEETSQAFRLVARAPFAERDVAIFLIDKVLASLTQLGRQVVGAHFNPSRVDLVMERPPYGAAYERVFRCPVRFGSPENRIYFPVEPYAVRSADPVVLRQVRRELARAEAPATVCAMQACVVQAIRRDLAAPPALSAIAESLHISERTLRRRLAERGSSYADLLCQERRSRALSLVAHSTRSIQQIALECGFSDARTLQRAFKRWTGLSPMAFRVQARPSPQDLDAA